MADTTGNIRAIFSAIAMLAHEQGSDRESLEQCEAVAVICTLADIGIEYADALINCEAEAEASHA